MITWGESWEQILIRIKHGILIIIISPFYYEDPGLHSLAVCNFGVLELQWLLRGQDPNSEFHETTQNSFQ